MKLKIAYIVIGTLIALVYASNLIKFKS